MKYLAFNVRESDNKIDEIVELLESLGGKVNKIDKTDSLIILNDSMSINSCSIIAEPMLSIYNLGSFKSKFPYKIGDRLKTVYGNISEVTKWKWDFTEGEVRYFIYNHWYKSIDIYFHDEDEESKVKCKPLPMLKSEDRIEAPILELVDYDQSHRHYGYKIPEGYKFDKVENGLIYLVSTSYPKTYAECCDVLGLEHQDPKIDTALSYYNPLMENLAKLLICRNAYWKLANNWEPDWKSGTFKYCILIDEDRIIEECNVTTNCLLSFPTNEMRSEFLKNFRDFIELCKELL